MEICIILGTNFLNFFDFLNNTLDSLITNYETIFTIPFFGSFEIPSVQ